VKAAVRSRKGVIMESGYLFFPKWEETREALFVQDEKENVV
jgi:hypothetical protein